MLAQRPPMGWNSWNTFGKNINEKLIMEIADALVEKGYKDAGYEYVVIDDCWSLKHRDENGRLVADPEKFPHGMKYLADYIHSKGLKFGMYSCSGTFTCALYPGSYNHEFEDAQTFADWGVDFLKYDFCYFPQEGECASRAYTKMSMALKATGRDILFSACNWGQENCHNWMRSRGVHMYRSTGDIFDNYVSFRDIAKSQIDKLSMSAQGCYNDADMLIVGMYGKGNVGDGSGFGGCTDDEYMSHFAMWCMMGSPLMIGGDIRSMNEFSENLLKNKGLIAINQDEEARPPYLIRDEHSRYVYLKHLSDREFAIGCFSDSEEKTTAHIMANDMQLPDTSGYCVELEDAMTGEKLGTFRDYYEVEFPPHGCRVFKARIVKR